MEDKLEKGEHSGSGTYKCLCYYIKDVFRRYYDIYGLKLIFPELSKELQKRKKKRRDGFAWNSDNDKARLRFIKKFKVHFI